MERFVGISSSFSISCSQVTLEEFTTAILAREQFSKMLTLKIIDIFVEDE